MERQDTTADVFPYELKYRRFIPLDALDSPTAFKAALDIARADWCKICRDSWERANDAPTQSAQRWATKAMVAIFDAGCIQLTRKQFCIDIPVTTPSELRQWCQLQFDVLERRIRHNALIAHVSGDNHNAREFGIAGTLLEAGDFLFGNESHQEFLARWHGVGFVRVDYDLWQGYPAIPLSALGVMAYRKLRNVPGKRRPAEIVLRKGEQWTMELARRELDRIVHWCDEQEDCTIATGTETDSREADLPDGGDHVHSLDFRSVRWNGNTYSFTPSQAKVIEVLWGAWKQGTPDIGGETLLQAIDHECPPTRLDIVFRRHPAWKTIIVSGSTKGTYRLDEKK